MADDTGLPHEIPFLEAADPPSIHGITSDMAAQIAARLGFAGQVAIATEQTTTSGTYTFLSTPDRIQNVVVPTGALVLVWYQALWKESADDDARAGLFIGSNQVKSAGAGDGTSNVYDVGIGGGVANRYVGLASSPNGLVSGDGSTAYAGTYPTTGHTVGLVGAPNYTFTTGAASGPWGGAWSGFVAAGTYDIGVKFMKTSAATVSVKDRRLWVRVLPF